MKEKLRVVVDTNVVVSGLLSKKGFPYEIIIAWINGSFTPVISKTLQEEINELFKRDKISKRASYNPKEIKQFLGILFNKAERFKPSNIDINILFDVKDLFLLELACSAKADVIVTGDTELLEYADYEGIKFLSPKDFYNRYL